MFTSSVAKYRASQKWREFLQKNCKTAGDGQRDEKSGIEKLAGFFFSALNKTAGNTAGENRLDSWHKLRNSQEHKWEKISW